MKKIDITKDVINERRKIAENEKDRLANMEMPAWMQKPFDEYMKQNFNADMPSGDVIPVDFSQHQLNIPKALAASSNKDRPWYDQGVIAFKDANGAIMNIIFNKSSHSNKIDVTVSVTDGESGFLSALAGNSELPCSLYDKATKLASLVAGVNHDGTFLYAEGVVTEDYEPDENDQFISLKFH